jgi:hypothetical protein
MKYFGSKQQMGEDYPVSEEVFLMNEWLDSRYLQNTGVAGMVKNLSSSSHKAVDAAKRGAMIDKLVELYDGAESRARVEMANVVRGLKVILTDIQKLSAAGVLQQARQNGVDITTNTEAIATNGEGMNMLLRLMSSLEDTFMTGENIKTIMMMESQAIQQVTGILSNAGDLNYEQNIRNIWLVERPGHISDNMIPDALKHMLQPAPGAVPNNPYPQYGVPPVNTYPQYAMPGAVPNNPYPQYGVPPVNPAVVPMNPNGSPYIYGNYPLPMSPMVPTNIATPKAADLVNNPNMISASNPYGTNKTQGAVVGEKASISPEAQVILNMYSNQQPSNQYQQYGMSGMSPNNVYPQNQYPQYGVQPVNIYPNSQHQQYGMPGVIPNNQYPQYNGVSANNPYGDIMQVQPNIQQPQMVGTIFNAP